MRQRRFPRLEEETFRGVSNKILQKTIAQIQKEYKKKRADDEEPVITTFDESIFAKPRAYVSSGILPIDCVVGLGKGFPTGIIEIFGPEASGKSAVLDHTLAAAQKAGYYTAVFPMEFSLDKKRLENVGVDLSKLLVLDAETIEDVYDYIRAVTRRIRMQDPDTPIVYGWDSIASTPTRTELAHKAGLEASDMGRFAAQISKLFRRMVRFMSKNKVCLICINQTRANIGVMYGPKETTPGGRALRFYAWVRCRISIREAIKDKEKRRIGSLCYFECIKNKMAPPFQSCMLPIYWTKGIHAVRAVWEYGKQLDVIKRKGTSYRFQGNVVTQKSFPKLYRKNKELVDSLIRQKAAEKAEEVL